jgi:hypothetical protein
MPISDWPPHVLAIVSLLTASLVSTVLALVILFERPQRYGYSALAGLIVGGVTALTAAGQAMQISSSGGLGMLKVQLTLVAFGVGLAALVDAALASRLPLLGRLRARCRRALRPWLWESSEEIAERAGVASFIPAALGVAIAPRPPTLDQQLARARIMMSVLAGSLLAAFSTLPSFSPAFLTAFAPGSLAVNAVLTALVLFFLDPLLESVHKLARGGSHLPAVNPLPRRWSWWRAATVFILLTLVESLHNAVQAQIASITVDQWVILIEVCALPMVVTTYYFGTALHRTELGARRWDRALEASVVAGTLVLLPFAFGPIVTFLVPQTSVAAIVQSEAWRLGAVAAAALMVYLAVLGSIALALVLSVVSYGVYAVALGLAMIDASPATAPRRAALAIALAGLLTQIVLAGAWWLGLLPSTGYLPILLTLGWSLGLLVSRFDKEMAAEEPARSAG